MTTRPKQANNKEILEIYAMQGQDYMMLKDIIRKKQ
jgi:hypothetical protein